MQQINFFCRDKNYIIILCFFFGYIINPDIKISSDNDGWVDGWRNVPETFKIPSKDSY